MIIKNNLTKEKVELAHTEFFVRFEREIKIAYDSYRSMIIKKSYFKIPDESIIKSDFNYDLQWNFNNLSDCNWYIEKI